MDQGIGTDLTRTELTRTDRALLRAAQVGAWLGIAATAALGVLGPILTTTSGFSRARLVVYAVPPPSSSMTIPSGNRQRMEVELLIDRMPAFFTGVSLTADLVRALGIGLILLGIAMLAARMLRGRPFADAAGTPLGLVLIGVTAGPTIADALDNWVSMGTFEAMGAPDNYGPAAVFSPMPIFIGLVVAALMIAFRIAGRLQRDTEGLV